MSTIEITAETVAELVRRCRAWRTPGETITGDVQLYLDCANALEVFAGILAYGSPAGVGEGWQMVPKEPTYFMQCAFTKHANSFAWRYRAMLAAAPSLPVPAQDAGVAAILGQVAGIRLWRDAYPDGPDVLDGTAYVSPDNVRRAREAISRHAPAPGQAGEDIELVPGMPEYWRDAIGGSYAPQVWGKYQALYPTSVAQAMRLAGQRAPECADVIAALVWQLGIVDVRDRHLSELVLELQGQAATPPNASAVKELEATARPSDADLHAFGASEAACIKWPNDTPEHKALRAAYTEGAAESRPSDDSV